MRLLPRHLTKPPDKASSYYHNRYAQPHPNSYYSDEQSSSMVLAMINRAHDALSKWKRPSPLPAEAANDLRIAYESLSEIEWHLPEILLWCCWTEYLPGKDGKRWSDSHVVWSAHLTQAEAEAWLPLWKAKFSDRDDYGWHASVHACRISDVKDPDVRIPTKLD